MSCFTCNTTSSAKDIHDSKRERFVCSRCNAPEHIQKDTCLDSRLIGKTRHNQLTGNKSETATRPVDLASGDHHGKSINKSQSEHNTKTELVAETRFELQADKKCKCLKTICKYKNANYRDSESDSFGLMSCPSLPKISNGNETNESNKTFPRPVACPMSDCGKVIAVESALLHFYFDHSKIQRITLSVLIPEQIHLKPSLLSESASCVAIFLFQNKECKGSESESNSSKTLKDYNPLLLMASKMQSKPYKYGKRKQSSKTALRVNSATQTENFTQRISQSYSSLKEKALSSTKEKLISNCQEFDKDEILLVWLCKLDVAELYYSITLLRDDKKQAHSYIGEPINIGDKQDSAAILDRADCLVLQGVAANRLIDSYGNINVLFNLLNYV